MLLLKFSARHALCRRLRSWDSGGLSLDTCTGWDLNETKSQEWVLKELRDNPPELLVV